MMSSVSGAKLMGAYTDYLEDILINHAVDPEEANAEIERLCEDNKLIFRKIIAPNDQYIEFLYSISEREGDKNKIEANNEYELFKFKLDYTGSIFLCLLNCLRSIADPAVKEIAVHRTLSLYLQAMEGHGSPIADSPNTRRFVLSKQAKTARKKRADSAEERALRAAIQAELGAAPVVSPWKIAEAILGGVNRRLEDSGNEPVKVDVIYRRLSAPLKSAENGPD